MVSTDRVDWRWGGRRREWTGHGPVDCGVLKMFSNLKMQAFITDVQQGRQRRMFAAFTRIGILQINLFLGGVLGRVVTVNVLTTWIRADMLSALVRRLDRGYYC